VLLEWPPPVIRDATIELRQAEACTTQMGSTGNERPAAAGGEHPMAAATELSRRDVKLLHCIPLVVSPDFRQERAGLCCINS